jgi:hypothetical protein
VIRRFVLPTAGTAGAFSSILGNDNDFAFRSFKFERESLDISWLHPTKSYEMALTNLPTPNLTQLLHFLNIRDDQGKEILWPCLRFKDKSEMKDRIGNLEFLSLMGMPNALMMGIINNGCMSHKIHHTLHGKDGDDESVAFLLGEEPIGKKRIVFGPLELSDFGANLDDAIDKYNSFPGYKSSLRDAAKITGDHVLIHHDEVAVSSLEPEFSTARLRFGNIPDSHGDTILWPCIIIGKYQNFSDGLKRKGLLSTDKEQLALAGEFINMFEDSQCSSVAYFFGQTPRNTCLARFRPHRYFDFDSTGAKANKQSYHIPEYWRALSDAYKAVAPGQRPAPKASSKRSQQEESSRRPAKKVKKMKSGDNGRSRKGVPLVDLPNDNDPSSEKKEAQVVEDRSIPKFSDVRPILEGTGYIFRESIFCRPGKDPKDNSGARNGVDFFSCKEDFRKHLCAHGVEGFSRRGKTMEKEKNLVERWVKYYPATSLQEGDQVPAVERLTGSNAWLMLDSLGFIWKSNTYLLPPGANAFGNNKSGKFLDSQELYGYLCRYGLPSCCNVSMIAAEARLQLELYVCEYKHRLIFT